MVRVRVNVGLELISRGIMRVRPPLFPTVMSAVEERAPVDRVEVVEWMQKCGTINHIMSPWFVDYSNAGGDVVAQANDGWYPGVFTSSYQVFARQTGDALARDGYVRVDNRYGQEVARVPPFRRAFFDRMRGMVLVTDLYSVQFNIVLAEFRRFAKLPFRGDMRLGAVDVARVGYMSLPAVFRASFPPIPSPRAVLYASYEAPLPGRLVVEVYDGAGELIGRAEVPSDAGNIRSVVTVEGWISGDVKVLFAFDGSEAGMNLYEVTAVFPPSMPL